MLKYLSVWCMLLLPLGVLAQQGTIKGTVRTPDSKVLELATIGIKGTTIGTQTNAAGEASTEGAISGLMPAKV